MPIITRRFEWDAGHRVLGHEGKCKNLHGHRYVAEITVQAPSLDDLGRVVDFGVLKEVIGGWIDEYWDHNMLMNPADPFVPILIDNLKKTGGRAPFIFAPNTNPTAETIAEFLFGHSQMLLDMRGWKHLKLVKVKVFETPNCSAEYPEL